MQPTTQLITWIMAGYKAGELERLHEELYDILERVIETCDKLQIEYAIVGGTAIGAHFEDAILPWDDDIDLGMERGDYERFLREAETALPKGYTLQSPLNEPLTPFYFAKVRKDGTHFEGEDEAGLAIHHGIYIDIFPLDRVPDNVTAERLHRKLIRILCNAFVSASGKLNEGGAVARFGYKTIAKILGKQLIYKLLRWVQSWYTNSDVSRVNIARMPKDHIQRDTLHPTDIRPLGRLMVRAPRRITEYLEWHYPWLERFPPEEKRVNHAPLRLEFSKRTEA